MQMLQCFNLRSVSFRFCYAYHLRQLLSKKGPLSIQLLKLNSVCWCVLVCAWLCVASILRDSYWLPTSIAERALILLIFFVFLILQYFAEMLDNLHRCDSDMEHSSLSSLTSLSPVPLFVFLYLWWQALLLLFSFWFNRASTLKIAKLENQPKVFCLLFDSAIKMSTLC